MQDSVRENENPTPDKNRGGRPRLDERSSDAIGMRRMLMQLRAALPHISMLTGRRLTTRGLACWIYWRDQQYPPSARHGLVPAPAHDYELDALRARAQEHVRRKVLHRIDGYIGAAARGVAVQGVKLRAERASSPDSFRVGGLPGLYWRDLGVPLGEKPGEPSSAAVAAVNDAVEVVLLSSKDLETLRRRYSAEVDDITVAELVAELLGEFGAKTSERVLRRRLNLARNVEFVHFGAVDEDGLTPGGKRLSSGAGLAHFSRRR